MSRATRPPAPDGPTPPARLEGPLLLIGDPYLVGERLEEIRKSLLGDAPLFGALDTLWGDRLDIERLAVTLKTLSLGGSRLVILRQADRMREELQKKMVALLDEIPRTTQLVVVAEAPDMRRALFAALKSRGKVEVCEVATGRDAGRGPGSLPELARRLAAERSLRLSPEGAEMLAEYIGGDAGRLASEIEKLSLRFADAKIGREEVLDSVGGTRALVAYALEGAVRDRKIGRAVAELRRALAQGERVEVIVGQLASELRSLLRARALLDSGMDEASAIRAFGGGRGYYVVPRARNHRSRDLSKALRGLAELDVLSKSGATHAAARLEQVLLQLNPAT